MVVYQVSCYLLGIAEHPSRFWGNVGEGSEGSSAFDRVDKYLAESVRETAPPGTSLIRWIPEASCFHYPPALFLI